MFSFGPTMQTLQRFFTRRSPRIRVPITQFKGRNFHSSIKASAKEITVRDALNMALDEELERDPNVFLMGEEVGKYQGAYKVSKGLVQKYGENRVIDTPITESGTLELLLQQKLSFCFPLFYFSFALFFFLYCKSFRSFFHFNLLVNSFCFLFLFSHSFPLFFFSFLSCVVAFFLFHSFKTLFTSLRFAILKYN